MEKICDPANIRQKSSPGADQINNLSLIFTWSREYLWSICWPLIGWGESLEHSDWPRSRHLNPIFWISDTGKHLIGFSTRRINYCWLTVMLWYWPGHCLMPCSDCFLPWGSLVCQASVYWIVKYTGGKYCKILLYCCFQGQHFPDRDNNAITPEITADSNNG